MTLQMEAALLAAKARAEAKLKEDELAFAVMKEAVTDLAPAVGAAAVGGVTTMAALKSAALLFAPVVGPPEAPEPKTQRDVVDALVRRFDEIIAQVGLEQVESS
jgi:hypothetical protein